ncbi:hypothetical protein SAMN05660874_05159 [Saccharopolyspora flava]|uniref:Uncharacterized protein n=2 Tax=Saccharopolyspora flava TaxID=95161 RepID=A0A1I6UQ92_9PSEU|nr:hypothetical protein SAMN05660874_05159 [Saccharopolyspora flava]
MSVGLGKVPGMIFWSLLDVERAIRDSWGADTCAPEDVPDWHPGNPARGQCGTTALVLHDFFGGELMCGPVHRDGEHVDYHWWNRFGDGLEVDLTREQFAPDELVGEGAQVPRPTGKTRTDAEYELLRRRVRERLGG